MCDQLIVEICNKIVKGDLFTTLDDIKQQECTLTYNDEYFHPLKEGCPFMISFNSCFISSYCRFVNDQTLDYLVLLSPGIDQSILCGEKRYLGNENYMHTTAAIDSFNDPNATGYIDMQVNIGRFRTYNARVSHFEQNVMGGYIFYTPVFDDILLDHKTYADLFGVVFDLTTDYDRKNMRQLRFSFDINRSNSTAVMILSQALQRGFREVTFKINFSNRLMVDFGLLDASKEADVTNLIRRLISAAL